MDVARTSLKLVHHALRSLLRPSTFARHYGEIPGAVHVNDLMLASESPQHVRHYLDDARSAIENLEQEQASPAFLSCADRKELRPAFQPPDRFLVFGSSHSPGSLNGPARP